MATRDRSGDIVSNVSLCGNCIKSDMLKCLMK